MFGEIGGHEQALYDSVRHKVKEMTNNGSVRNLLQGNPQERTIPNQQSVPQINISAKKPMMMQETPAPLFQPQAPTYPPPAPQAARANNFGADLGMALGMGAQMANQRQNMQMAMNVNNQTAINMNNQMGNILQNMGANRMFPAPPQQPFQPPGFNNMNPNWTGQPRPNGMRW